MLVHLRPRFCVFMYKQGSRRRKVSRLKFPLVNEFKPHVASVNFRLIENKLTRT